MYIVILGTFKPEKHNFLKEKKSFLLYIESDVDVCVLYCLACGTLYWALKPVHRASFPFRLYNYLYGGTKNDFS